MNQEQNVMTNSQVTPNVASPQMPINQAAAPVTPNVQAAPTGNIISPIIVNGIDVSGINAFELDEDLIDEMTEEQADQYLQGRSEAEVAAFNEKNGFSVSMVLSEEELAKREAERAGLSINLGHAPKEAQSAPAPATVEVKKEQTGSVIFGVKK